MSAVVPDQDVHPTVPPDRSIQLVRERDVSVAMKSDREAHYIEKVISPLQAEAKRW
jgi:hypothetical protein